MGAGAVHEHRLAGLQRGVFRVTSRRTRVQPRNKHRSSRMCWGGVLQRNRKSAEAFGWGRQGYDQQTIGIVLDQPGHGQRPSEVMQNPDDDIVARIHRWRSGCINPCGYRKHGRDVHMGLADVVDVCLDVNLWV
jgi:hypothetical protein